MITKKITQWVDPKNKKKYKERTDKIRLVEQEILNSRLNKQYKDLGEYVFKFFIKKESLVRDSSRVKKHLTEIQKLQNEKKKLEL